MSHKIKINPLALSADDLRMMDRALALAATAAATDEVPVGAVVYRGREILGEGHNQRERLNDPTAHAEVLALREASSRLDSWRLDDCSIAVTLEPCPMCAGALINARVKRLVYGAADPKMGCVDSLYKLCTDSRFNHRLTVIGPVDENRCGDLLRAFFQKRRAKDHPGPPDGPV